MSVEYIYTSYDVTTLNMFVLIQAASGVLRVVESVDVSNQREKPQMSALNAGEQSLQTNNILSLQLSVNVGENEHCHSSSWHKH